ncbi:hypothetical protein [Lysinibacillus sp. Ag94]|uniref:hypothetical protein n=1 Tax=Lysinibacillus sp. Ag94 TaxID=2936682 RepID=UPI00200C6DE3|nr:hypothetical protein [Lysinibacillus sp. Ag94]UPW82716.1 hypothetical protein MY533_18675 [Lysinibacillus sp. Ag94]
MKYTPNLNLKKPDLTDSILISDINENMETLDGAVSELQKGSASIPDLETADKTLAGAINEVKNEVNKAKKELANHATDPMPHIYTNSDNNKKYRLGFGVDAGGFYFIQQEVE